MSRRRLLAVFAVMLVFALIALVPMRVAITGLGLDARGFAAREAIGTIWEGGLREARLGAVPLGELRAAVDPLPLLIGRARVAMGGSVGHGWVTVGQGGFGVDAMTAQLPVAASFAPLPVATIGLEGATITFQQGRCARAEGRVRATFTTDVAGLALAQGLTGTPRCEGGRVVLRMISVSAMERLTLRVDADGDYDGEFLVRPADPAMAARLTGAGFTSAQGGLVMRLEGSF